jgi:hypothetical protein
MSFWSPLVRRTSFAVALLLAMALTMVTTAPSASADAFGQLGSFGQPLPEGSNEADWLANPKQLNTPAGFGVDASTGNVFVLDSSPDKSKERLQEFEPNGTLVASATLPRTEVNGSFATFNGIAIDPSYPGGGRLYMVEALPEADTVDGTVAATKLLVYSTTPTPGVGGAAGTLHPVTGLQAGLTLPDPSGSKAIDRPGGVAVEPTTHKLLITGEAQSTQELVVVRLGVGGTSAATEEGRLVVPEVPGAPLGIVAAPDGDIYLAKGKHGFDVAPVTVFKVAANLSAATEVPALGALNAEPGALEGADGVGNIGTGPQLAISPDGQTIYYTERLDFVNEPGGAQEPAYRVRGVSVADGSTKAIYGGGSSSCQILVHNAPLAVGPGGVVWALDREGTFRGAPAGGHIVEFGPGGTGCPIPNPRFSVNGGGAEAASLSVAVGSHLTLQADTSQLFGATPTAFEWDLDGSGAYATHQDPAAGSTEEVCFEEAKTATLGLRMKISGGALAEVPPAVKTIKVESQAPTALLEGPTEVGPGQAATFDGSRSFRLACSAGGTSTTMKSYSWNFGDGTTATGASAVHAFAAPGTYQVSLTVEDAEGLVGTSGQAVVVPGSTGGGGGGGAGGGGGGGNSSTNSGSGNPAPGTSPGNSSTTKKTGPAGPAGSKQTPKQKALAACAKKHGKAKARCVKSVKKKFAPKKKAAPKKKHKAGK